jgi:hypothetical protein
VNAADLTELHYITPIANVPSILKFGILSNREITRRRVKAVSVALSGVQERRESKVIPGAKPLHEYVNLYICARNPMMYLRRSQHEALCVLQINPAVMDLPGAVIADGNAASGPTAFWQSPTGLSKVNKILSLPSGGLIQMSLCCGRIDASNAPKYWFLTSWMQSLLQALTFHVRPRKMN